MGGICGTAAWFTASSRAGRFWYFQGVYFRIFSMLVLVDLMPRNGTVYVSFARNPIKDRNTKAGTKKIGKKVWAQE